MAVRSLAGRMLDGAARLNELRWPTIAFDELGGSAVESVVAHPLAEDRLADVVAHLRTWASAVKAAAAALEQAEVRHAD
ncbi:MAG: hypothetical protein M3O32_22855, partial [Actinomycetota bacterium]|nr:hypothetical protein [Actinomycetota bacterium]